MSDQDERASGAALADEIRSALLGYDPHEPFIKDAVACINALEARLAVATDALRGAPEPIVATQVGADEWDDVYEEWWNCARRAALGVVDDE